MAHPFPACQVAARCLRGARERAPDGGARDRAQGRAGGPRGRRGRRRRRGRRVPVRARLDHGPGLGQRLQPGLVLAGARAGEHHVRAPPAQRACAVRNEAGHRLGVLACSRYLPILRMGCTASCERGSAARLMPGLGSTACAWIAGMLCGRACCRQPGLWRWWQRRCSVGQPSCGGVNSLARARAGTCRALSCAPARMRSSCWRWSTRPRTRQARAPSPCMPPPQACRHACG